MANTACFMIVARNDIPIYEAEVGSAAKVIFNLSIHSFMFDYTLPNTDTQNFSLPSWFDSYILQSILSI